MKKTNFLCVVLLLLFITSYAKRHIDKKELSKQIRQQITRSVLGRGTAKNRLYKSTSEEAERLIAQSQYMNTIDSSFSVILGISDSLHYKYSGGRTSYFNYNAMRFYNGYQINGQLPFGFGANIGFEDHNDRPDILCDTSYEYMINPYIGAFGAYENVYTSFDMKDNVLDYIDNNVAFGYGNRYINDYDTAGKIVTSIMLTGTGGAWDTSELRKFYYTADRLTMDTTMEYDGSGMWTPEETYQYTYNAYGNITEMQFLVYDPTVFEWQEFYQYDMDYYATQKLQTINTYTFDSGYSMLNAIDSFGWTTGLNYYTLDKHADYSDSGLVDYTMATKHTTDSLPDTMYNITYYVGESMPMNNIRISYTYDSYKEPTHAIQYLYDSTTGAYDSLYAANHYYYELYERHANAIPVTTENKQINVYPNPAADVVYIARPDAAIGAYTSIKLINAAGQLVRSETLPWMQTTESISLKGLVPGTYWLIVQDKSGANLCRQAVIKQ